MRTRAPSHAKSRGMLRAGAASAMDSLLIELVLTQPIDFRDLRALLLASRAAAFAEKQLVLRSDEERFITPQDLRVLMRMLRSLGDRVLELHLLQKPTVLWDLPPVHVGPSDEWYQNLRRKKEAERRIAQTLATPSVGVLYVIAVRCPNLRVLALRDWVEALYSKRNHHGGRFSWLVDGKRPVLRALARLPRLQQLHIEYDRYGCDRNACFGFDAQQQLSTACPLLTASNLLLRGNLVAAHQLLKLDLPQLDSYDFPKMAACVSLRHLTIQNLLETVCELVQHLSPLLEVLVVRGPDAIEFTGDAQLDSLQRLPRIQVLKLPCCNLHDEPGWGTAARLGRSFPDLRVLNVDNAQGFGDAAMSALFEGSRQLIELHMAYAIVTQASFEAIRMGELPWLRILAYNNDQFEVNLIMNQLAALPPAELDEREDADRASFPVEQLETPGFDGMTHGAVLSAGYAYLRAVRDRSLALRLNTMGDYHPSVCFRHALD